jgi:DNA polymerase
LTAKEKRELAEIARAVRAHAEWQADTGAIGLPRGAGKGAAKKAAPSREIAPERAAPLPVRMSPADAASAHTAAGEAPKDPEARKRRLVELASGIRSCQKCPLHAARTQTVFARGNPSAELCFVGEGPGADEDAQGEPFVGKAGQLLDRMIGAMGFSRDEVYVCNIVKCRPPGNRKPEPQEMAACAPYLAEQLSLVAPKVLVALGATAVEGMLGPVGGITRIRGSWRLYKGTIPVMPTFHPAYLLRNPPAKKEVWQDLQAVLAQMGRPVPAPVPAR